MNRKLIVAGALLAAFAAKTASAQVVIQMAEITCQQFMDADLDRQLLLGSWMSGYYSASRNLSIFEEKYAQRNAKAVIAYCKKHKAQTFMAAVQKTAR